MMIIFIRNLLFFLAGTNFVSCDLYEAEGHLKCPQYWVQFQSSCYRFIKSPIRPRIEAQRNCQAYNADLVSISSLEEHGFIVYQLLWQDPQHRRWYTGARQQSPGYWINEADSSSLSDLSSAFVQDPTTINKDYLAYNYTNKWILEPVSGEEHLLYICESPINKLLHLIAEDRTFSYGTEITDPEKVPKGPYFIKEPKDVIFDRLKQTVTRDVSLSCLAGGYPAPTYEWYKDDYENDKLVATKIDPLSHKRYTLSGGTMIIYEPQQIEDRGSYHCKATNKFGSIISESIQLTFGFIGEFNLKRSPEQGFQNWGKAIFCDPPQHYPGVKYFWSREHFPSLVEEDKRVFVSYDGALYFSSLEQIDKGYYGCNVQNEVISTGRNGPFFPLIVNPHSNHQQLQFPNNFPKVFPEAPVAGQEVRLECIAFGYPVPSYNWTRKGSPLPRTAYGTNYNRVLIIPSIRVEDQGEYVCRINNNYAAIENSVVLSIQAEPNFTIPLADKHMDNQGDLTWTCEAFGVPDVSYMWYRNGEPLIVENLPVEDSSRYTIQDNILTIKHLNPERDPGMYQCRARNTLRTKFSSAQLRVLSLKPSFKRRPLESETYAAEGGRVTILCNPEAAPKPKYTWKKDGNVIGSGGRRMIFDGNLTITPVSRDDTGIYTCIAQNAYGIDDSQGRLTVLRGPSFAEYLPPKISSIVSQDIELRCYATSEDMLDIAYVWRHNGMKISTIRSLYSAMIVESGRLSIYNITFSNAGDYECAVKSVVGSISTHTTVLVEGPPGSPGGVQVVQVIKKSVTLQWTDGAANGKPIIYYIISGRTNWNSTWFNITNNVFAREVDRYTGRKEALLEDVLSPWSVYEFRVQAGNELGTSLPSETSPQHNTAPDKPYIAPSHVTGGGGKIGDLTIRWKPLSSQDQNGPGIFYKVYWRRHQYETEFQTLELKSAKKNGVAIVSVPQEFFYTQYDVKVQAANELGYGPESQLVTVYSAEDIPHIQPQSVQARSYNSTALNVSWTPITPTRENIRGKLIGHRLKYWKKDTNEDESVYYLSRSTNPWALIVGLQPNTYYIVKVMAFNGAGAGPESERFIERTYRKAPQNAPTSVFIKGVNPSTFKIFWRYVAPNIDEEPPIGFKIRVWPLDQDMSTATDTIVKVGSQLEAYVTGLQPGKKYNVRVLAFSNGGDGRMSSPTRHIQMGRAESFVQAENLINAGNRSRNMFYGNLLLVFCMLWKSLIS